MYSLQGFPDEGSDNMKIEKVNENQIRCTLTREDLAERQIKLSELAYGTEKAKMLFHVSMKKPRYLKKQRNARFSTTAAMSHRLRMRISAVRPMASPKP